MRTPGGLPSAAGGLSCLSPADQGRISQNGLASRSSECWRPRECGPKPAATRAAAVAGLAT